MADEIIGRISVGDGATFTPAVDEDGVLSWSNNKNLPNPATVDIAQAVVDAGSLDDRYLQLSGGTMTGTIDFSLAGNNIKATNDDGYLVFRGGNADTSASLVLRGNNYTQYNNPGSFSIRATDGNTYTNLDGKSDGTLTWAGNNIITSAGGTLTGALALTNIKSTADTNRVSIVGGTDDTSAYLNLYGKTHASYAGQFSLTAFDGTNRKSLAGKPDGALTWSGKNVLTDATVGTVVSNNISSSVSLTASTAKTITSVSLSAGVWVLSGHVNYGTATQSKIYAITIGTSNNNLAYGADGTIDVQASIAGNITLTTSRILSLSATTTVYLCGYATTSATASAGHLTAVRIK